VRIENWESKLFAYLETVGPFEWAKNDCCVFVSNAIVLMRGDDVLKDYRGYKTKLGAQKILKKVGGIEGLWTKILGESISHKLLKRGDVVFYSNKGDPLVGLCVGSRFVALTESGIVYLPMNLAEKGWKV
jgi:hypothetical protein